MRNQMIIVAAIAVGLAIGVYAAVWRPTPALVGADAGMVGAAPSEPGAPPESDAPAPAREPAPSSGAELVAPSLPAGAQQAGHSMSSGNQGSSTTQRFHVNDVAAAHAHFDSAARACRAERVDVSGTLYVWFCGVGNAHWIAELTPGGDGELTVAHQNGDPVAPSGGERMCTRGMHFLELPRGAAWSSAGGTEYTNAHCAGTMAGGPAHVAAAMAAAVFTRSDFVTHRQWRSDGFTTDFAAAIRGGALWVARVTGRDGGAAASFALTRTPLTEPAPALGRQVPFFADEKAAAVLTRCPESACAATLREHPSTRSAVKSTAWIDRCLYACEGEHDPPAALAPIDLDALRATLIEDAARSPRK